MHPPRTQHELLARRKLRIGCDKPPIAKVTHISVTSMLSQHTSSAK